MKAAEILYKICGGVSHIVNGVRGFQSTVHPWLVTTLYGFVAEELYHLYNDFYFCPAPATWIFLGSIINLVFPKLLPYFNLKRLSNYVKFCCRVMTPWLLYKYAWIPCHQYIHEVVADQYWIPYKVCAQWISFLSMLLAISFMTASLHYTGNLFRIYQRYQKLATSKKRPGMEKRLKDLQEVACTMLPSSVSPFPMCQLVKCEVPEKKEFRVKRVKEETNIAVPNLFHTEVDVKKTRQGTLRSFEQ